MKRSDIAFYLTCIAFGIFNHFTGWKNLAFTMIAITVAIIVCVYLKKYDGRKITWKRSKRP